MEKVLQTQRKRDTQRGLNPAQERILPTLQHIRTEEEIDEIQKIIRDFYIKKAQNEADKLWEEGKIGDFLLNEHLRTTYK
jgi:hypothetical protein